MRYLVFLSLVCVAACDLAGPGFQGVPKVEREVENSRFTLRFSGGLVEVIRTSPEILPRFDNVARKAFVAVKAETGCDPAWVSGDAAMMMIGLACPGQPVPKRPKRAAELLCDVDHLTDGFGRLTCRPTEGLNALEQTLNAL